MVTPIYLFIFDNQQVFKAIAQFKVVEIGKGDLQILIIDVQIIDAYYMLYYDAKFCI